MSSIQLFSGQRNFRPVQIQRTCRRQNKCNEKIEICFGNGRKHSGKGEKCCIFLFPKCFQKPPS